MPRRCQRCPFRSGVGGSRGKAPLVVQDSRGPEELDLDQAGPALRRACGVHAGHAGRRGRRQGVRLCRLPLCGLGARPCQKRGARMPRPQACRRMLHAVRLHAEAGGRGHDHGRHRQAERSRQAFGNHAQKGKDRQEGRAGGQVRHCQDQSSAGKVRRASAGAAVRLRH